MAPAKSSAPTKAKAPAPTAVSTTAPAVPVATVASLVAPTVAGKSNAEKTQEELHNRLMARQKYQKFNEQFPGHQQGRRELQTKSK